MVLKDLTGMRFGKLKVLKRDKNKIMSNGTSVVTWECQCDCGNIKTIVGYYLTNGITKSCGCLQKELASKRKSKINLYDLSGKYGIGYTSKNEEFWFDLEQYDLIKSYCWRKRSDGMFDAKVKNGLNKRILLHRLILNTDLQIDHINHLRHDNRKSNLRTASNGQNRMNTKIPKNNNSGQKGVIWHKRDNIWEAYITFEFKRLYLGRFINFEDAVKARKSAEKEYFKDYNYKETING